MRIFKTNYLKMIKSTNWVNRRNAIWKIDDQQIIKEIAEKDSDENVRMAAVDKLKDNTLLMQIAKHDLSSNVREVALSKLNTESRLRTRRDITIEVNQKIKDQIWNWVGPSALYTGKASASDNSTPEKIDHHWPELYAC